MRALDLGEQREALAGLNALGCTDADVCLVKTACLEVVTPTVRALQERDDAVAQVARLGQLQLDGSVDELAAARDRAGAQLDSARDQLEAAKQAVPKCEAALSILERAARGK